MGGVGDVEGFKAVFDETGFVDEGQTPAFRNGGVDVGEARSEEDVAAEGAVGAGGRVGEAGDVIVAGDDFAFGAAGIEDRVPGSDKIGAGGTGSGNGVIGGTDAEGTAGLEGGDTA